jgi:ABC-2 type transport system ATP-binding protein
VEADDDLHRAPTLAGPRAGSCQRACVSSRPLSDEPVISVRGLRKSYDDFEAVKGIDLTVGHGEVFAFLGPNGAGKTTTVEILEGYRQRNAGDVSVLGVDPAEAGRGWRERIGIVLQQTKMHPELTVRETLDLFAGYYEHPREVSETITIAGLEDKQDERVARLSGGQQRRLDVGVALIGDPDLLFLDEPTTGFDPSARRRAWDVVASLRSLGKTVFLTTHYMDEAQVLADRVAIIAGGRIVAEGPPDELGQEAPSTEIRFRLPDGVGIDDLPVGADPVQEDGRLVVIRTAEPIRRVHQLTGWALEHAIELPAFEVGRPSLEDVYLDLTRDHAQ